MPFSWITNPRCGLSSNPSEATLPSPGRPPQLAGSLTRHRVQPSRHLVRYVVHGTAWRNASLLWARQSDFIGPAQSGPKQQGIIQRAGLRLSAFMAPPGICRPRSRAPSRRRRGASPRSEARGPAAGLRPRLTPPSSPQPRRLPLNMSPPRVMSLLVQRSAAGFAYTPASRRTALTRLGMLALRDAAHRAAPRSAHTAPIHCDRRVPGWHLYPGDSSKRRHVSLPGSFAPSTSCPRLFLHLAGSRLLTLPRPRPFSYSFPPRPGQEQSGGAFI